MSILRMVTVVGVLVCLVSGGTANAQKRGNDPFDLPGTLPVPEWVKVTDWSHPNVYALDSMIAAYRKTARRERESDEVNELNEDPYINAYLRWRSGMMPFIQEDGSIKYDPNYHRQQLEQSLGNQSSGLDRPRQRTTASANWTLLGPVETYKAGGAKNNHQANIYCIAAAPSNPSVLYAGSEPGSFFRSADKGLHWASVSDTLYSCGSRSIAVDPHNDNTVYTYDGTAQALLKTTTGGATWSILSTYTARGGNAIGIHNSTGRILITGDTAIYYSDNNGATWTRSAGSGITYSYYDLALNPANNDTVYAVGANAARTIVLLRSTNGGTSFNDVTGSLSGTGTSGARLGVTVANTNVIYCANLGNTTPPCIIKSTDRGASWAITATSTNTSLTGGTGTTGLPMSNGQGYYDLSMVVSPANANDVIVGTTTTYKSTDGGNNFRPLGGYSGPFGLHPDLQQAIAIGGDAYLATDGGVNYSSDFFTNTSNWSVRNYGLRSSDFWGFGQGWDEDIVVGGRYHNGNGAVAENYSGGKSLSLGGGEDATGHVFHGYSLIAGFRDIGNLKLPDTITGSVQYSNPDVPNSSWPQDDYYGLFSSKLMVHPRYSNTFFLGKDSVLWMSVNRGATYTSLRNFGNGNSVWRYDIARGNPSVIYVCTKLGLRKTTDAGTTWSNLTLPATWSYYNTDVVVNPLNENDVYVCMANAAAANKVFRSIDGGATWTNMTGSMLNNKKVAFLQYHGGSNGGVYAVVNTRPSKVYYRDSTMSDWVDYSTGLPTGLEAREGALIFFRDNKIRLCGNCSVWESPLYTTGAPVAQPMADRHYAGCARDTINFFDYSIVRYAGVTRTWSFPGATYVSSPTALRPKVVYPGPGYYSVSLTVTNAAAQTHTRTIDSMIIVTANHCAADTVAGTCLQMNGTNQTVNLGKANINSNTFSISCWVQPTGNQSSFSQIVSHDLYPGSAGYGFGFGFTFSGYTPNLRLCYTDSIVNYGNRSSLICDSTKWNYVVLTYSPAGVVMYLNGVADTVNNFSPMPAIDLSQSPFVINFDNHPGQGSKYKGKIDEVKFYNYTLSQNEVREKMHLIPNPATETGLIKYYQFNQYDPLGGMLYDVASNFGTPLPASNIVTSTAPVSTGLVLRNPAVTSGGLNDFSAANVKMHLPSSGTYPDGEVVAFHLFSNPDTKPDARPAVKGYFVVNNYGTNATFSSPDSVVLSRLPIYYPGYRAGNFRLFRRATGDFGNTWGTEMDSARTLIYATGNSALTWGAISSLTSFNNQFIIVNNDTTTYNTKVPFETTNKIIASDVYPNPCSEWCQVNIHLPGGVNTEGTLTLTNVAGEVVLRVNEFFTREDNHELIHLPKLAAGTYFLSIEIPGYSGITKKVVVE